MEQEKKWCVYIHRSPSNKAYIGITSKKPEKRWGKDGSHYLKKNKNGKYNQSYMANAMLKYNDWSSWEHIIFMDGLTKTEACRIEQLLIALYHTNNAEYGYNLSSGGENGFYGCHHSEEHKQNQSDKMKGLYVGENNPMYGISPQERMDEVTYNNWKKNIQERMSSEEVKEKLRQANIGKKYSDEINIKKGRKGEAHHNYGKPMSDETKEKLRQAHTGKRYSDEVNAKKGLKGEDNPFYGKKHTEESKSKMSASQKKRYENPEERKKASERTKKQMQDLEMRKRLSEAHKGKKHSEETKKKMSETRKGENNPNYGKKYSVERIDRMVDVHPNRKMVVCLETGTVYRSLREAERLTGICYKQISDCCKHKPHCLTAGGFQWMFYTEYICCQEVAV